MSIRARTAASAAVLIVLLVGAELVARAQEANPPLPAPASRAFPFGMFAPDADAGVALARHVWIPAERFATNTFGHRDRAREAGEPPPWSTRIAVVGGTTGAGRGIADEHTFARLLEDSVNASVQSGAGGQTRGVEVWNLAVPGYGAEQALLRLEADWETVQPDTVLFAFDLGDTPMRTLLGPGGRTVVEGELLSGPWKAFASSPYEDERAAMLQGGLELGPVSFRSALQRRAARVAGPLLQTPRGMAPFDEQAFGGWGWLWVDPPPDPVDVAWRLVEDSLHRISQACKDKGATLVLLAVPARVELDDDAFAAAAARGILPLDDDAEPARLLRGAADRRLSTLSSSLGVSVLKPIDALRAAGEPVYYEDLPTWNAAGHRVAADFLGEALAQSRHLPPHDAVERAGFLARAVPRNTAETRFDGGFRAPRDRPETPVRWERAAFHAW